MSWRTMLERSSSRSRKIRGSNYVQIATVDPQSNEPRCRTVVFRGFLSLPADHFCAIQCDELPCAVKMITDSHSEKVSQVTQHSNNVAELLWWFPRSSEQYRIRGNVVSVGNGQFEKDGDQDLQIARKQMWGNISDSARESFLSGAMPGQDFVELTTCPPTGGRDQEGKLMPAPDNFLLVLLLPKQVDYLSLTNNYRQVDSLVDGRWTSRRVMP
jgi:pyridoxamine 5'-phosphate oxidase